MQEELFQHLEAAYPYFKLPRNAAIVQGNTQHVISSSCVWNPKQQMNMETTIIRPGPLSFVLQIARFTGAVPLSFKVLRNGYKISVSRFQQAYCFFILTILNILSFMEIYFTYFIKTSDERPLHSSNLFVVFENCLCIISSTIGYMGSYRMKNMIQHLNGLEKIRHKINYDFQTLKHDKSLWRICFFLIILYTILIVLDNILKALRSSVYDTSEMVFAAHYFVYLTLLLLKIQIAVLNFEVYKIFLALNKKLRCLLTLVVNGNESMIAKTSVVNNQIRNLTQCYISICKVTRKINKDDGFYMLLIYLCFTLFGVFNGYRLILALNEPTDLSYRGAEIILRCIWCTLIIGRNAFFVEPFERISYQVAEMIELLTKLTLQITSLGREMPMELDIMVKQVIVNVPQYCPLGLLMLNRSLLTTTFSVITTYLVFVIQIELNNNEINFKA